MRQRLAAIYVLLLVLVLAGLEVPLAITLASRDTQQMALDRLSDAVRFATIAEPALRAGDDRPIREELDTYYQLYDIEAAVVNLEGRQVARTPGFPDADQEEVGEALKRALQGEHVGAERVVWPWQTDR